MTRCRALWLLAVPLLLAGCFQQAGESLQSVEDTAVPLIESTALPLDESEGAPPAEQVGPPTVTVIPITVIAEPTNTPIPNPSEPAVVTPTRQFITPGVQALPFDETDVPTQLPVNTPSGLITPTDLFSGPSATPGGAAGGISAPAAGSDCTYTVQPGDNLFRIAVNNDTTVDAMRTANPELAGQNPVLQPGQVLRLPDCGDDVGVPAPAPTATPVPVEVEDALTPAGEEGGGQIYVVQPGDTLLGIALRFDTTVDAIVAANELLNPDRLSVGQELVIP